MKKRFAKCAAAVVLLFTLFAGWMLSASAADEEKYDFSGKDAGQVIEEFLTEMRVVDEYVGIAYENTVTGETYLHNGDRPITAASLFKVPLCMYWTEKIGNGEYAWEDRIGGYKLEYAVSQSLIESNNTTAAALSQTLGTYRQFRQAMVPFYGIDEETASKKTYWDSEDITAQQMLHCLEMLYAEPERYPRVIDYLLEAEPDSYFRAYEDRFPIAQKYGFLSGKYSLTQNTAGILYTDDPFLLVVMTEGAAGSVEIIGRLAQRLCDYTQFVAAERKATPEPTATPEGTATPEPTPKPVSTPAPSPTVAPTPLPDVPADAAPISWRIPAAGIAALLLAASALYIRRKKHK